MICTYIHTYVCTYVTSTTRNHSLPEGHLGVGGGESLCLALSLQTLPQTTHIRKWNKDGPSNTVHLNIQHSTVNHMMTIATEHTSKYTAIKYTVTTLAIPLLCSLHLDILWNMLYCSASSSIFSCRAALSTQTWDIRIFVCMLLHTTKEARLWSYVRNVLCMCNTVVGMVQMCVG